MFLLLVLYLLFNSAIMILSPLVIIHQTFIVFTPSLPLTSAALLFPFEVCLLCCELHRVGFAQITITFNLPPGRLNIQQPNTGEFAGTLAPCEGQNRPEHHRLTALKTGQASRGLHR